MNLFSWLGVVIGCIFLIIIILCYVRHLVVFGVNLPCSTLKTDYFGRPYPDANPPTQDPEDPQQDFDPDEAARGNKYYPILTADEARRSSASVSTIRHLLQVSDINTVPGMAHMLDSSIDEDDFDSVTNQARARCSDVSGAESDTTEDAKKHNSADNAVEPQSSLDAEPNLGAQSAPPERRMSVRNSKKGRNKLNKSAKIDGTICEDVSQLSSKDVCDDDDCFAADVEDSDEQTVKLSFSKTKPLVDQKLPDISTISPAGFLQVPSAGFGDAKFSRNKSKSLRESKLHKSASPIDGANSSRKRMSLDRFLTSQCQYCVAELMTDPKGNTSSIVPTSPNLRGGPQGGISPGGVPQGSTSPKPGTSAAREFRSVHIPTLPHESHKYCDLCVTESLEASTPKTMTKNSSQNSFKMKNVSTNDQKHLFKNTFVYQSSRVSAVTRDRLTSKPSFENSQSSMDRCNGNRCSDKRRSASHLRYPKSSPSNSLGGEQATEAEQFSNNYLLNPNANVRRTRSTRERRRSRHCNPNDPNGEKRISPTSPRGGSFRDRRTSTSTRKKLSPRLTSFEDFQNFSLLMAGHKVEIPAWKKHEAFMKTFYNSSRDADVSS